MYTTEKVIHMEIKGKIFYICMWLNNCATLGRTNLYHQSLKVQNNGNKCKSA